MHEPLPRRTVVQADVTITHVLHRDYRDPEPGRLEEGRRVQVRGDHRQKFCVRHTPSTTVPCSCGSQAIRFRRNLSKLQRIRAGL